MNGGHSERGVEKVSLNLAPHRLFDRSAEAILSTKEAAAFLGITTKTLRKWMKNGKIPHRAMPSPNGESYRFFRTELVGWLDRRKGIKLR